MTMNAAVPATAKGIQPLYFVFQAADVKKPVANIQPHM